MERHINSNTGSCYHCELCEDRTFPRVDKLYDHLRDGHKVTQKVLDRYRNKALRPIRKESKPIKSAPVLAPAPVATTQVSPSSEFGTNWSPAVQVNGMAGRHAVNMPPSSFHGVNSTQVTVRLRLTTQDMDYADQIISDLKSPRIPQILSPSIESQNWALVTHKTRLMLWVGFLLFSLIQSLVGLMAGSSTAILSLWAAAPFPFKTFHSPRSNTGPTSVTLAFILGPSRLSRPGGAKVCPCRC